MEKGRKITASYISRADNRAICGECSQDVTLGGANAPFDTFYCPHCGAYFNDHFYVKDFTSIFDKINKDYKRLYNQLNKVGER